MSNIQPRYRQVPALLAQALQGLRVLMQTDNDPALEEIFVFTQLAYTGSEMVQRDCDRAVKDLRMGYDRSEDRYVRQRERSIDDLIRCVLEEHRTGASAPSPWHRGEVAPMPAPAAAPGPASASTAYRPKAQPTVVTVRVPQGRQSR